MTRISGPVGRPALRCGRRAEDGQAGFLALEWVLTLPVLALLVSGLLLIGAVLRDVLVLEEAARVAARTAAVTADDGTVVAVARDAAPELDQLTVHVRPPDRRAGQQVTVTASTTVRYGPVRRELTARSSTVVEAVVQGPSPAGFPTTGWARGPHGTHGAAGPGGPHDPWRTDP